MIQNQRSNISFKAGRRDQCDQMSCSGALVMRGGVGRGSRRLMGAKYPG